MEESLPFQSSLGIKYPAHRNDLMRCPDLWLEDKRTDDGAEGLWRIHNKLYDLNSWIDQHPGGRDWIRLTKGTDITEAFQSYHISTLAEEILPTFYVREARQPRNSPYTFHTDGFYQILKSRIRTVLETVPESAVRHSKIITDLLLFGYVSTAIISAITFSFFCGILSGILLALTTIAAHNFFHQRDNFRLYYFDLSCLSSREWRISHAMSHHLFTNTINDLEISLLEPFLLYLPAPDNIFQRGFTFVATPFFHALMFISSLIKRILLTYFGAIKEKNKRDALPFIIPLLMYLVSGRSIIEILIIWLWIVTVASTYFGFLGVNAAHHHPELFHDGDTPRIDRDWGLAQMDSVMDRRVVNDSSFLVLTSFGDHALHHLFPTLDHGKLVYLRPVLIETCAEFDVKFRVTSQLDLIIGQFFQLLRDQPNPHPPGVNWNWYSQIMANFKGNFFK